MSRENLINVKPMLNANKESVYLDLMNSEMTCDEYNHIASRHQFMEKVLSDDGITPEEAYKGCAALAIDLNDGLNLRADKEDAKAKIEAWWQCYREAGYTVIDQAAHMPAMPVNKAQLTFSRIQLDFQYCEMGPLDSSPEIVLLVPSREIYAAVKTMWCDLICIDGISAQISIDLPDDMAKWYVYRDDDSELAQYSTQSTKLVFDDESIYVSGVPIGCSESSRFISDQYPMKNFIEFCSDFHAFNS